MRSRLRAGTAGRAAGSATAAPTRSASWTRPRRGQDPVVEALGAHRDPGHAGPGQPLGHGGVDRLRGWPRPSPRPRPRTAAAPAAGPAAARGRPPAAGSGVPPPTNTLVATGGSGPRAATAKRRLLPQRGRARPPQPLHPGIGD